MNICGIHDSIIKLASNLQAIRVGSFEHVDGTFAVEDLEWQLSSIASEIEDLANQAKDAGQKMEDRLRDYRNAIEDLGFKRIENKW